MTEQNETQEIESNTNESKVNEVIIVKKRTLINCEEFVSIQLKSSEGTIGKLLKKAGVCFLVSYQANVVNLDFIMRRQIFINSKTLSWYLLFNEAIIIINSLKFILTET